MDINIKKIPIFLHIPKNTGTYIHYKNMHLFRRYGLKMGWDKDPYEGSSWNLKLNMISVVFKNKKVLSLFVYDNYNILKNNKNFNNTSDHESTIELYPFLYELLNNKLEIFSMIVASDGFNMMSKLNFDGLNVSDYICKIIKRQPVYYTIFRDCFSRTVSMYNYLNSYASKHEPTYKKIIYNSFEEYIKSHQLEDSWLIRQLSGIPDKESINEECFNNSCNILNRVKIADVKNVEEIFENVFKECYDVDDIIKNVEGEYYNKNSSEGVKIDFDTLDEDIKNIFLNRTVFERRLYNKYIV